jgi:polysaccharide biosynthesis/export protein
MLNLFLATILALQSNAPRVPKEPSVSIRSLDHVVSAQEVLKVTVFDEPQLSGSFRIDADGTFTYPFIGRIKAAGETLRTIEATLGKLLADGYVRNPQVSIEVEQPRSQSVFVVGEVRSPGKIALTGQMTLIEALAQAGSTTSNAGTDIMILRASQVTGSASGPGDMANVTRVNLADLQAGRLQQNVILGEGDTVFVPKAQRFYVTGHVKNPGAFTHERDMTVLQAISVAGGLSERGSNRGIKVVRIVDGEKKEISVKLTDLIQANDTVIVRQRLL